jgi:hypothetical protein
MRRRWLKCGERALYIRAERATKEEETGRELGKVTEVEEKKEERRKRKEKREMRLTSFHAIF